MDAESDFRAYVAARIAALSRVAYLLTGDWHAAEDLVQLTLINVARHWERVSATGEPDPYVRRVLYNQHVSAWRRRRRTDRISSPPDGPGGPGAGGGPAHDGTDDIATAVVVQAAMAKLTRKQRAVLVLRFFEDRSEVETADVLRCSVSTVKSQTRDALARIRVLAPELHDLAGRKVPQ